MKSLWTIALGLSAQAALAQMHPPPQPMPDAPVQSAPTLPEPGSDASGTSTLSAPGASGGAGTSGASGGSSSSGPGSDAHGGSADTPGSVQDASGASGMQSEAGAELRAAPPPVARVQPRTQGDVTYLCGGVGAEEAAYMTQQARGYDLMLTFAARDGSYLADVNVDIRDAQGKQVLQANCDAPMMLVDVPKSGTYRIRADAAGYELDRTAKVRAKQKAGPHVASVVLSWPQQVAEGPASPGAATGSSGGERSSGAR
ncbi:hypothetical protein [Noviherbaspirillum sp. UKPF54]|uniref:hypothetical protein n=1 Tax=Noviherbaspirillum sp. UKPF54 TaxID=2601898 RepID=UPI0011B14695|nr:hypothetical protein [Noviherbaspirillum sp. UKPF54]QDZ27070.1 hypothetical protein FAY22_03285 [Noviherbaspirillum sp. UKPF54]